MVAVDHRKGSEGERYHHFAALVDSGATYNFISQAVADRLGLQLALSGRRRRRAVRQPPLVAAVNGESLRTTAVVREMVRMRDSAGVKRSHAVNFVVADIRGYDVILGMAWLKKQNPDINWDSGVWHWRTRTEAEDRPICLVSAAAFVATMHAERTQGYEFHFTDLDLDRDTAGDVLMATGPEPTDPDAYKAYVRVFSEADSESMPNHGPQDLAIELLDGKQSLWGPIYNLSEKELATLRDYLETQLKRGWIRPSKSPAGAPVLFVPKKDGTLRLCVDFRGLNQITKKNRYPLLLISESIDRLAGARYFTKLDMREAYYRLRIASGDEWKTAFRTRYGHYEYTVVLFGLVNVPAAFKGHINSVLREHLDQFRIAYLDDIVVYSNSLEEHTEHVQCVLAKLQEAGLYLKLSKCEFNMPRISFVGSIITLEGVEMEPDRVRTIAEWPEPESHRDIQVFLGFANFYRRFISAFSKIAKPMTDMLKGGKNGRFTGLFVPTPAMKQSFQQLREAFTRAPVLVHFDPAKPIRLETDASGYAIAGIISQQAEDARDGAEGAGRGKGKGRAGKGHWHPVAFWSRSMAPAERNYTVGDQEMLAIVMSCRHWRHYLEGARHPVEVLTDHHNLQRFMTTKALTGRQASWWETLSGYNLNIVYRAGSKNPANAPSRRPDYGRVPEGRCAATVLTARCNAMFRHGQLYAAAVAEDEAFEEVPPDTLRDLIRESLKEVPIAREARTALGLPRGDPPNERNVTATLQRHYQMHLRQHEGLLYHWTALYVPGAGGARTEVLRRHHDDPLARHFGSKRTLDLVARKYYWPGMSRDVKAYCKACLTCQRVRPVRHRPHGSLEPLPQPRGPWTDISMDFVVGLPESSQKAREKGQESERGKGRGRSYNAILVIVDRYTKAARYFKCRDTLDAAGLAEIIARKLVLRGAGVPESVVSDRGPQFTAKFWAALCYHLRIGRRLSTAYHPQTDGQTERQNQTLEQYVRAYVNYEQDDWVTWLPLAELAYNNSVHASTGVTPFYAERMVHPSIEEALRVIPADGSVPDVPNAKARAEQMVELRAFLEKRWREATATQRKYADRHTKPREFAVGDMVWLSGKNIRTKQPSKKLDHRFYGPYLVIERVGMQAYRLKLLQEVGNIHDVFRVSLLEPYVSDGRTAPKPPPPIELDGREEYEL
jgi:hypothetical protein